MSVYSDHVWLKRPPNDASVAAITEYVRDKLFTVADREDGRSALTQSVSQFFALGNDDPTQFISVIESELNGSGPSELPDASVGRDLAESPYPPLGPMLSHESEPVGWLIRDLAQEGEFGVMLGSGGAGKSTFLLYSSLCVALGKPVLGRFDVRQGGVVNVSEEDGYDRYGMRGKALCQGHGWSWSEADKHILGLARAGVLLDDEGWRTHLLNEIRAVQPAMIVLDPLRDLTLAPENDNAALTPVIRWLRELTEMDSKPTICLAHHTGYATNVPRAGADQGRGWSSLPRAARYVLVLTADDKREGQPLRVSIGVAKNNDVGWLPPFGFEMTVTTAPNSHAWETARLEYRPQDDMKRATAHDVLLEVVTERPGMESWNQVKQEVKRRAKVDPRHLQGARDDLIEWGDITSETDGKSMRLYPTKGEE